MRRRSSQETGDATPAKRPSRSPPRPRLSNPHVALASAELGLSHDRFVNRLFSHGLRCRTLKKKGSAFQKVVMPAISTHLKGDGMFLDVPDIIETAEDRQHTARVSKLWRAAFCEVLRSNDPGKLDLLGIIGGADGFEAAPLDDEMSIWQVIDGLPLVEQEAIHNCIEELGWDECP